MGPDPSDGIISPECARGLEGESDAQYEVDIRHMALGCGRRATYEVTQIVAGELEKLAKP